MEAFRDSTIFVALPINRVWYNFCNKLDIFNFWTHVICGKMLKCFSWLFFKQSALNAIYIEGVQSAMQCVLILEKLENSSEFLKIALSSPNLQYEENKVNIWIFHSHISHTYFSLILCKQFQQQIFLAFWILKNFSIGHKCKSLRF